MNHLYSTELINLSMLNLFGFSILGIMYYYYLNKLKYINCNCVDEHHHHHIKKYFGLTFLTTMLYYSSYLVVGHEYNIIVKILFAISVICHVMLIYQVRHMLIHIKKNQCNCAESVLKEVIDIVNIMEMTLYIFLFIFFIANIATITTSQHTNAKEEWLRNVMASHNNNSQPDWFQHIVSNSQGPRTCNRQQGFIIHSR